MFHMFELSKSSFCYQKILRIDIINIKIGEYETMRLFNKHTLTILLEKKITTADYIMGIVFTCV